MSTSVSTNKKINYLGFARRTLDLALIPFLAILLVAGCFTVGVAGGVGIAG